MRSFKFLASAAVAIGLIAAQSSAFGGIAYLITVDTSSLSGQSGWMEMQFNPGGAPVTGNAVVSNFLTNSTLNPASIELTGSCTGDVSPPVSLVQFTNSTQLNDYFESIIFGTTLSLHVMLDGDILNPPNGTLSGSSFFLGFFNSAITVPLLSDPDDGIGSAARIDVLFDGTIELHAGTSATTIVPVPEPTTFGLLIPAGSLLLRRRVRIPHSKFVLAD